MMHVNICMPFVSTWNSLPDEIVLRFILINFGQIMRLIMIEGLTWPELGLFV
jgi:hypothetical protein